MDKFDKRFISRVADGLQETAIKRMDAIGLTAHTLLVQATPVDLGQARAGWNFSLNVPNTTAPGRPPEGEQLPLPAPPVTSARAWGDSYFITNFVGHIVFLNEGSSQQQPEPKFVERSIFKAVKAVESAGEIF